MREREPEWYERARKGPFEEAKFTDVHAGKVMRRVKEGEPHQERKGFKFRAGIAAAGVLLLVGAGVFYLGTGPFGEGNTAGPSYQHEETADVTEAGMIKTAEKTMQEQLGKKLPFESIEPQVGADQVRIIFKDGDYYANIWVSTETGQVMMYSMSAIFAAEEIDDDMLGKAKEKLRELGYKGEFKADGLTRFVDYGRVPNQAAQVSENLFSEEAQIGYVNGKYDRAYFAVGQNEIADKMKQAGLHALGLFRSGGTDKLSKASRYTGEGVDDEITLFYGPDVSFPSFVITFNDATQEVMEVSDSSLFIAKSSDLKKLAEQDRKLLDMENSKLQSAAAAIADGIFGIRLEDYTLVKNQSRPGIITFESGGTAPAIEASYNLEGVMYSFKVKREMNP
ncbi:hypothetical protein H70357_28735 [Paenibacillus sp. FSL H7-0357]|uniref:hypothetical protein n=1 Tax=Paenibacillus sp. FSL H7-0357 TaxID=1536774 RepID=UPI0004F8250D|nr:hypothetical protein [Paenibacillus sp. FSL H7-0357]AIQ20244.1 hypothetical protein H70357_28735 [Paenibacillus sp. FSL H7-0357]